MGCFSKFFLFALNFLVFAVGVAVVALASYTISQSSKYGVLLAEGTLTLPIWILVFGLGVMLIGFFGCFGALRESKCLLYTYATIVLALFIGQLALAIVFFIKQDDIKKFVSDGMTKTFKKYGEGDQDLTNSLDVIQHEVHCCGVYNYTDWYNSEVIDWSSTNVAPGCCKEETAGCNENISNQPQDVVKEIIWTEGCYTKLIGFIDSYSIWIGVGAIVLCIVQLACISCACGLAKKA